MTFQPNSGKVSARRCCVCGRTRGVTWHAWELDGVMRSIPTHLRCFLRLKRGQATIAHADAIPPRRGSL